jgi:dUTP pyrophosphatase
MNFMDVINNAAAQSSVPFVVLKLAVNKNNLNLNELYKKCADEHNKSMLNNPFPNSGFDLYFPEEVIFEKPNIDAKFVDLQVKCEMISYNNDPTGFLVHPRSSISKTPLMLANHTGIIDSGYRGNLIGAFRWLKSSSSQDTQYIVERHTRLLQICHPSLCRIFVNLVDENELSTTVRGAGGFGSTGI